MTLGEQLKKLRSNKALSQPELAALANIEQSYLSKLENDKSIPSNEIFRKLLVAFDISVEQFLGDFDNRYLTSHLSQIPDIEHWLAAQNKENLSNQRHFLYLSSALLIIATTLFYTGFSAKLFRDVHYQYESQGVILAGEPNNIFSNWRRLLPRSTVNKLIDAKALEMTKRRDDLIYLSAENLGDVFVVDVDGGKRRYRFDKEMLITQRINAWLQILGVLLFSAGIMGFVLERRMFK